MKKILLFISLIFLVSINYGQISINSNDLAATGSYFVDIDVDTVLARIIHAKAKCIV